MKTNTRIGPPIDGSSTGSPVAASQSRQTFAPSRVNSNWPSGENVTHSIGSGWAMGEPIGRPVSASQSLAFRSAPPVASRRPSREISIQ